VLTVALGDLLLVPGAVVDELLKGLFGVLDAVVGRERDAPGEGFDALAFAVLEQSVEVDAAPGGLGLVPVVLVEDLRGCEEIGRLAPPKATT
jgi:hypothetical protein